MNLKKWVFTQGFYYTIEYVAFAETLKEAFDILKEVGFVDEYESLDDYDIEERPIKNPEKAYKGCYINDNLY